MKPFLKGLFFGGGVFGLIALLNNPNPGETNRKKLKDWSKDTEMSLRTLTQNLKSLQNAVQELSEQGNSTLVETQKSLAGLAADFIDSSEPQMLRLKNNIERLKTDLADIQEKVEELKPASSSKEAPKDEE
ncbi:MAG: hypothetical protein Q4A67_06485 [Aerococcus sp.]|nr:hypothetical protein [Aerococcus sp.]